MCPTKVSRVSFSRESAERLGRGMSLPHANAGVCDHCAGSSKEMIREHLGEIVEVLDTRFCSSECRDTYISSMIDSANIDHEHKRELLERFPNVLLAKQQSIAGHMGSTKHSHKEAPKPAAAASGSAAPMIRASLFTSLKRKVSGNFVVDTGRISDILIDMTNYFADKLDASEPLIKTNASVVVAAMLGTVASNGYADTERAKSVFVAKWTEALKQAGRSQEFFPTQVERPKKVIETPSLKNKELATELAVLFSANSDARRAPSDINHLHMQMQLFMIVDNVVRKTGQAGYLFLMMFPIDVRGTPERTKVQLEEFTK